jgi:hypothetical protein
LLLFLAPVGLRLATAVGDAEAMRCAIACGHATGALTGAACCPMSDAPGSGPRLKSCSPGADAAFAPMAPAPMLLVALGRLAPPEGSRPFELAARSAALSADLRLPDKVPLRAG